MATVTNLNFYKKAYGLTEAIKQSNENKGGIYFDTETKRIYVGGVAFGAEVADVKYEGNILTITKINGEPVTLDFSDTASATATLNVFQHMNNLMGVSNVSGTPASTKLDYSGTNYIEGASSLVDADKLLDTKIKANADAIAALDSEVTIAKDTEGVVTLNTGLNQTDGKITNIENDKVIKLAKVATTGESTDVAKSTTSEAEYDIKADVISTDWVSVVTGNALTDGDSVDVDLNKLDKKIAGLADELIRDEQAINMTFGTIQDSVGLETDFNLDLSGDETKAISEAKSVKEALIKLDSATVHDVKVNDNTIVEGNEANLSVDGTYNIDTNKIATQSTVTNAIAALDTTADVQAVTYTAADTTNGAKLTFKGISEVNGVIKEGSGTTELQFKKVATTGKAADVAIDDTAENFSSNNVEGALHELATTIASLAGGMRYNGGINAATATVNQSTGDIRPGDIYLASGSFVIEGTSVEAGDMIVYKGDESTESVALDSENCTVIERETDTMVTAGDTLNNDYLVFGNGNKEVATSYGKSQTISATDLAAAIANANSALQSIAKGTDGTYVTTTVGTKDTNNQQTVGVAVTQSTVTYTEKSGNTPANLTASNGLLNQEAIVPIKNYVDAKVGTAVQSVNKGVDTTNPTDYTYITVTQNVDNSDVTNPILSNSTSVTYGKSSISESTITVTDGVAVMSTAADLIDQKISLLDAVVTSDDAAIATVKVEETDGKISGVVVTTTSAGVSYTPATGTGSADLTATTDSGAVTGGDITTIKSYIDAQKATVTNANATIPVNNDTATTLATVDSVDITAKVSFTWEVYD